MHDGWKKIVLLKHCLDNELNSYKQQLEVEPRVVKQETAVWWAPAIRISTIHRTQYKVN